jgi:uncharacterized membrane protein YdjX (TVP38/TMEM64 family)
MANPVEPVNDHKKKIRNYVLLAASVIVVFFIAYFISKQMIQVKAFIQKSGWIGIVFCILLYGVLGVSPIPSDPLTVFISAIYGPIAATLVAGTGNLLAAEVEYFYGNKFSSTSNFDKRIQTLPMGLNRLPADSPTFLIVARMVPGYGSKFVSLIGGLYHVPIWRYTWTTMVSTYIGAAVFAFGGWGILSLL